MSVINYKNQMAQADARADAERVETQNVAVWQEMLDRHLIGDNTANYEMFRDFANPMTIESCEYLLRGNVKGFTLSWVTREDLIRELATTLRDNTTTKTLSDYDWRTKVRSMSAWTLPSLRAYKRELQFKQTHRTVEAAQQYLANARATKNVVKVLPADITASVIKKMNPDQIRRLVRDWTVQAVNSRLFGRN
jgi:hypothetical protein